MTVERTSPGSMRPIACEGKADSLTSTIKLSSTFSPVRHDRENLSEVMLETISLDKSGSSATGGERNIKYIHLESRSSLLKVDAYRPSF